MTTATGIVFAAVVIQLASVVPVLAEIPSLLPPSALALSASATLSDFAASPADAAARVSPDAAPLTLAEASVNAGLLPAATEPRYSLLDHDLYAARESDGGSAASGRTAVAGGDQWPWRRATAWDYLGIAAGTGGALYMELVKGEPKPNWTEHNAFDEGIRDNLRLKSRVGRDVTHIMGNALMAVMIGTPIVEPFAAMGLRDDRWDAFWQTEMINLESFAFTSVVASVMQNLIARERPFVRNCSGGKCEGVQENRSMPSGHSAFAFTGAGLLCNHHKNQPLYGDHPGADSAICTAGIWVSVADAFLRIMADRHYMTDALAGSAIGIFSGFVLPNLLHYNHPSQRVSERKENDRDDSFIKSFTLAPEVYGDGGGMTCSVHF